MHHNVTFDSAPLSPCRFFPACSDYFNDSKGCKCVTISSCRAHTHSLPCSLALPLLGFPGHVQMHFFLSWDSSGGHLHLLDKIGNFWVLQLTVLSLVNMTCKMRDLVVAVEFYVQYCVSLFWVGQSPEVRGAKSLPKALIIQHTKLLVLTEPFKHHLL